MNVTDRYTYIDPQERIKLMRIHAHELGRMIDDIERLGELKPVEASLLDIANRHLVDGMEVLKGIKFGRA